ncbi:MAG: dihydrolipoamide acetyltransferase family protein [Steroidobacteraceae bacterium]
MSSAVEIRAPAEQTEGTRLQILRWLKAVGDDVTEAEPLIEIETDKVTVEVAAPGSGILREILKQEQDEIEPGELLGRIEAGTSMTGGAGDTGHPSHTSSPSGNQPQSFSPSASEPSPHAVRTDPLRTTIADADVSTHSTANRGAAASLSPAVRRLLTEHGLEASAVRGTGQGARVTVEDVLRRVAERTREATAANSSSDGDSPEHTGGSDNHLPEPPARAPDVPAEVLGLSRHVPHSALRRRIAEHMVQSLHTAPHVTSVFEANLSAVLEHRQRHREEFANRGVPLTLTAYFLQAAVAAIRAVPETNSRWTDTALEIFESIHIGVATALDSGLVVPVLRNVHSRDLFETAQGLDELVSRAREGRLTPSDVRGGTFTISNHGVSGSLVATPIIINRSQAAILGVGKLEKRAVVPTDGPGEERIVIQPRCYVTLTIDHRVMDGHQANRFLQTFVQRLESSPP